MTAPVDRNPRRQRAVDPCRGLPGVAFCGAEETVPSRSGVGAVRRPLAERLRVAGPHRAGGVRRGRTHREVRVLSLGTRGAPVRDGLSFATFPSSVPGAEGRFLFSDEILYSAPASYAYGRPGQRPCIARRAPRIRPSSGTTAGSGYHRSAPRCRRDGWRRRRRWTNRPEAGERPHPFHRGRSRRYGWTAIRRLYPRRRTSSLPDRDSPPPAPTGSRLEGPTPRGSPLPFQRGPWRNSRERERFVIPQ